VFARALRTPRARDVTPPNRDRNVALPVGDGVDDDDGRSDARAPPPSPARNGFDSPLRRRRRRANDILSFFYLFCTLFSLLFFFCFSIIFITRAFCNLITSGKTDEYLCEVFSLVYNV
jgi:hypothetical protein